MDIEQQEDRINEHRKAQAEFIKPNRSIDEATLKKIQTKSKSKLKLKIDKFFKITERGSSIKQEFVGGLVNFLVLSYILVVIPGIFSGVGGAGLWKALFVATILTTIISTIAMALSANLPIVMAPGIGLASYVFYGRSNVCNYYGYWFAKKNSKCYSSSYKIGDTCGSRFVCFGNRNEW